MKRVKGFNFDTEEDKNIIEYIEKQGNQSSYIKKLVKDDMEGGDLEVIVKKEVEKYLKEVVEKMKNYPKGNRVEVG